MTIPAQVIVVGSFVQDQTWLVECFAQVGETVRAHGFNTGPGGKGFNQAIACTRQGAAVTFIGAIGNDALGGIAQQIAEKENLPCRWQICAEQPTAAAGITVNARGENQIAISLGANEHLEADFVRAQIDVFATARVLLLQMENNLDALAAALDLGTQHDLLRVWNPAPVHPDLDLALLRRADIVTPNETEFTLLLQRFGNSTIDPATLSQHDDATLHALARQLDIATVVITLGAQGSFVSHGENQRGDSQPCYRIASESVLAIDTTGAGDAFSGALVAALVLFCDRPFRDAIRHANRVAALSTETVGAAPAMPSYAAVIARFGDQNFLLSQRDAEMYRSKSSLQ
jgi:ribokinase